MAKRKLRDSGRLRLIVGDGDVESLRRICREAVEKRIAPGVVVCYGFAPRSTPLDNLQPQHVFSGSHAYDNSTPVGVRTLFDIASLTKPFTAALAMQLCGEGCLSLGDRLSDILPGAPQVTVKQLLGHAAGFPAHVEFFRTLPQFPDPRGGLLELARSTKLAYPSGEKTIYSDVGYILLGFAIEHVTKMSLSALFDQRIRQPIGLGNAGYSPDPKLWPTIPPTEVTEERGRIHGVVHDENAFFSGGVCGHAGIFASALDLARFAGAVLQSFDGDGSVLPSAEVQYFLTHSAAPETSWRLGWDTPSQSPGVSHAGDRWPRENAVGHLGFTGTSIWLDLEKRAYAVILTNRVHPSRDTTGIRDLRRSVMDWIATTLKL